MTKNCVACRKRKNKCLLPNKTLMQRGNTIVHVILKNMVKSKK